MWALKLIGLIWEINGPCPNYSKRDKTFYLSMQVICTQSIEKNTLSTESKCKLTPIVDKNLQ
jgi:hypothetical protein